RLLLVWPIAKLRMIVSRVFAVEARAKPLISCVWAETRRRAPLANVRPGVIRACRSREPRDPCPPPVAAICARTVPLVLLHGGYASPMNCISRGFGPKTGRFGLQRLGEIC